MKRFERLGELEQAVLDAVWTRGPATAEVCREALAGRRPMKDSTVRTVLRRLEEKGYIKHKLDGRTFVYHATQPRRHVAAHAVQGIIDRFCGGSVEQLLVGMVEKDVLGPKELRQLARQIAERKGQRS
jgi:BlaI family transcriptional regulator, penicillinase repressor